MNIGAGLTMNPSAANITNITNFANNNYQKFMQKQEKQLNKYNILSGEQYASSSAISRMPKTPPTMERSK